jgi:selenocysteine lyase/cysteine desulfurase
MRAVEPKTDNRMDTLTLPAATVAGTASLRALFDVEQQVPLLDGRLARYINFDNAASTPALRTVQAAVNQFLPWYASVHRGSGFKSQLATQAYAQPRLPSVRISTLSSPAYRKGTTNYTSIPTSTGVLTPSS